MPSTTTRRANPRRAKAPVRAVNSSGFEPLHLHTKTKEERGEEERVVLFTLDDDEFTIPKRFSPAVALKFLRSIRRAGMEFAMGELLEDTLGADAYDALVNYPDLETAHLERLMEIVRELALGSLDGPKGRSTSAS